jgi:hypothetical protein
MNNLPIARIDNEFIAGALSIYCVHQILYPAQKNVQ